MELLAKISEVGTVVAFSRQTEEKENRKMSVKSLRKKKRDKMINEACNTSQ